MLSQIALSHSYHNAPQFPQKLLNCRAHIKTHVVMSPVLSTSSADYLLILLTGYDLECILGSSAGPDSGHDEDGYNHISLDS